MREYPFLALLVVIAACDGSSDSLPSGDGYGPLGNGTSSGGAASQPTSAPTSTPAPTSTTPTPPPPASSGWSDAGWHDAGWSDAGGSSGWGSDAGDDDAGTGGWVDSGGWATDAGTPSTLLSLCVGEINELRNQNGAFPYIESSALEAFAAQAASSDAQALQFHQYFNETGGGGVSLSEDEFDGGQIDPGGTAQQVLEQGLLDDEQNQNGGFDNLVTNQFSEVGCGFAQDSIGNWWVTIEFR
jgi:hypothetical protein